MQDEISFSKDELLQIKGDEPIDGFREFWEAQYAAAMAWKPSYHVENEVWSPEPGCRIYKIRFTSIDGFSIGMWISRPAGSAGGKLVAQGYGNLLAPPVTAPGERTTVLPCLRGLGLSQCKEIPWRLDAHAGYGFEAPERYVIVGGVRDLWIALTIMIDMFPDTAENVVCSGSSLGGAMGALALPWDARLHYGDLSVPTLGGRIALEFPAKPGTPAGTRVQKALASEVGMRILDLCSASAAARFIRVPTLITPALKDKVVPPPGQFAVANSIPEKYRIMRIREVGHASAAEADPALEAELTEIRNRLFAAPR